MWGGRCCGHAMVPWMRWFHMVPLTDENSRDLKFPKFVCWKLHPQIQTLMVFGGGPLRSLGLDEVLRVAHHGISGFIRRGRDTPTGCSVLPRDASAVVGRGKKALTSCWHQALGLPRLTLCRALSSAHRTPLATLWESMRVASLLL